MDQPLKFALAVQVPTFPPQEGPRCSRCWIPFGTLFPRRVRCCSRQFCSSCSNKRINIPNFSLIEARTCWFCYSHLSDKDPACLCRLLAYLTAHLEATESSVISQATITQALGEMAHLFLVPRNIEDLPKIKDLVDILWELLTLPPERLQPQNRGAVASVLSILAKNNVSLMLTKDRINLLSGSPELGLEPIQCIAHLAIKDQNKPLLMDDPHIFPVLLRKIVESRNQIELEWTGMAIYLLALASLDDVVPPGVGDISSVMPSILNHLSSANEELLRFLTGILMITVLESVNRIAVQKNGASDLVLSNIIKTISNLSVDEQIKTELYVPRSITLVLQRLNTNFKTRDTIFQLIFLILNDPNFTDRWSHCFGNPVPDADPQDFFVPSLLASIVPLLNESVTRDCSISLPSDYNSYKTFETIFKILTVIASNERGTRVFLGSNGLIETISSSFQSPANPFFVARFLQLLPPLSANEINLQAIIKSVMKPLLCLIDNQHIQIKFNAMAVLETLTSNPAFLKYAPPDLSHLYVQTNALVSQAPPPERMFAKSSFQDTYASAKPPSDHQSVITAFRNFATAYCSEKGIENEWLELFFVSMEQDLATHLDNVDEPTAICMRLWTSPKKLRNKEFCSMLNEIIREDNQQLLNLCIPLIRGINQLCIDRRMDMTSLKIEWPEDHLLYRGAGIPDSQQQNFQVSKKYRCAMFLATSKNKLVSQRTFCRRAQLESGLPPVMYHIRLSPQYGCCHVSRTNVPGESEFLFVPYSVFTVIAVNWKSNPTWLDPHEVELLAAVDNSLEPLDLPLLLWH